MELSRKQLKLLCMYNMYSGAGGEEEEKTKTLSLMKYLCWNFKPFNYSLIF